MNEAVSRSLHALGLPTRRHVAALVRTLASVQTSLRLREEFDISGTDSGPVVSWAITTFVQAVSTGNGRPDLQAKRHPRGSAPAPMASQSWSRPAGWRSNAYRLTSI
jgi:hypothetical protein